MSTDFGALKEAVRATLEAVPRVGKIETRVGGIPTWIERPRPVQAFWEMSVTQALEMDSGAGPQYFEDLLVRIEGVMPFEYKENTEAVWDTLLRGMKDALRVNPCLKVAGVSRVHDSGRPQLTLNNLVTFSDGGKDVRCHHAVIELRCRTWNHFTLG